MGVKQKRRRAGEGLARRLPPRHPGTSWASLGLSLLARPFSWVIPKKSRALGTHVNLFCPRTHGREAQAAGPWGWEVEAPGSSWGQHVKAWGGWKGRARGRKRRRNPGRKGEEREKPPAARRALCRRREDGGQEEPVSIFLSGACEDKEGPWHGPGQVRVPVGGSGPCGRVPCRAADRTRQRAAGAHCPRRGCTEWCGEQGRWGRPVPGVRKPVCTEVTGGPRRPSSLRDPARWSTALPSQRGPRLQAAPSRPPTGLGIEGGGLWSPQMEASQGPCGTREASNHLGPLAHRYSPQKPLRCRGGARGGIRNTGSGDHPAEGPISAMSLLCELGPDPDPL